MIDVSSWARRYEAELVFMGLFSTVMRGLPYRARALVMIDVRPLMSSYFCLSPKVEMTVFEYRVLVRTRPAVDQQST